MSRKRSYVCMCVCERERVCACWEQQTIQKTFRSRSRHNWLEEGFVFYIFSVRCYGSRCHSHITDVFRSSLSVSFGFNGLEQPSIYCSLNLFGRTWCILKFSTGLCLFSWPALLMLTFCRDPMPNFQKCSFGFRRQHTTVCSTSCVRPLTSMSEDLTR